VVQEQADGSFDLTFRWERERPTRMMTWSALQHAVDELAWQVHRAALAPNALIGVLQGGWVVAQCLADHFPGVPVLSVAAGTPAEPSMELFDAREGMLTRAALPAGGNVLLVDEVVDSGRSVAFFRRQLCDRYDTTVHIACLAASLAAEPAPEFAAQRIRELPALVLPWRVLRDFDQTVACVLRATPMTTDEIDERLREFGHDFSLDVLDAHLHALAADGHISLGEGKRWQR
jgi:hypoxanthine phosphoribosyltransferase